MVRGLIRVLSSGAQAMWGVPNDSSGQDIGVTALSQMRNPLVMAAAFSERERGFGRKRNVKRGFLSL
jgi:hypothetical protein